MCLKVLLVWQAFHLNTLGNTLLTSGLTCLGGHRWQDIPPWKTWSSQSSLGELGTTKGQEDLEKAPMLGMASHSFNPRTLGVRGQPGPQEQVFSGQTGQQRETLS